MEQRSEQKASQSQAVRAGVELVKNAGYSQNQSCNKSLIKADSY